MTEQKLTTEAPLALNTMLADSSFCEGKAEELFYIQDTRSYLGNAVVWWGENGGGYTADITKAGKYTKEKAKSICKRDTDKAWLCSHIDNAKKVLIVDRQYIDDKYSRAWRGRAK